MKIKKQLKKNKAWVCLTLFADSSDAQNRILIFEAFQRALEVVEQENPGLFQCE